MKNYETLLRRLRADPRLFDGGSKEDQVGRLIEAVKQRLQPTWAERMRTGQEARLERWFAIQ
jgi:hypothetical protein